MSRNRPDDNRLRRLDRHRPVPPAPDLRHGQLRRVSQRPIIPRCGPALGKIINSVHRRSVSNAAALIVWTFCAAKHPDAATKYYRHNNNNHHHNYKHKHRHSNLTNSSQPNTSPNNNTNPNLKTTPETIPNPNPNSDPNPNSNLNPIPKFPHRRRRSRLLSRRHKTTYLFALLFLSLTLLLLIRLQQTWSTSPTAPLGSCYVATSLLASPGGSHPYIDKVYVAVTAAWLLVVLFVSVFMDVEATGRKRDGDSNDNGDGDEDERGDGGEGGGGDGSKKRRRRRDWKRKFVLLLAVAQFPVHLYAVVALRAGNQAALEGVSRNEGVVDGDGQGEEGEGEGENDWDFGQTTAVLLLLVTLHECFEKGVGLWRFERELKRSRDGDGDGDVDLESDAVGGRGGVLDGEGRVSRVER